jgi:site-specific DNA recombinase
MTVALYVRVSTTEQALEGYSISAQKERLLAYCTAQGWNNTKLYVDEGVSAKNDNRPELQKMLNDVGEGKISNILVYRLDRFTRKVKDLHKMLEFLEKHNCAFTSATEPYDTSSAMGKLFITIVAALAEWETDNLSERVKMALEKKVADGERVGGIPFGFDLNEDEKLVANDKAEVILDIINNIKNGMSVHAVAKYLNQTNNDKPFWHQNTIMRILNNPALYGATRWNDKVYEDTHKGIITKQEFLKLQTIFEDRVSRKRREVKSTYLFQGVLLCPWCGSNLTTNRAFRKRKDGTQKQVVQYKCNLCYKEGRGVMSIGEPKTLDALYEYMANVNFTDVKVEVPKDDSSKYREQLQLIEKKREKYQRAWAADLMNDDEFTNLMQETRSIYDELKDKLKNTKAPAPIDTEALKNIVFSFNENFHFLTHEEKQRFISRFIRKIEFKLVPQPPKVKKHKKGLDKVVITNIEFY